MAEEPESLESNLYCVICKVEFPDEKSATTVTKGLPNLEKFPRFRNRDDVVQYITTQRNKDPKGNVYVNPECSKVFVNLKRIKKDRSCSAKHSQKEKAALL